RQTRGWAGEKTNGSGDAIAGKLTRGGTPQLQSRNRLPSLDAAATGGRGLCASLLRRVGLGDVAGAGVEALHHLPVGHLPDHHPPAIRPRPDPFPLPAQRHRLHPVGTPPAPTDAGPPARSPPPPRASRCSTAAPSCPPPGWQAAAASG